MLSEIKQVLVREGVRTAVIIDDAYDETPTLEDIEDSDWDIFGDDLSESDWSIIRLSNPSYGAFSRQMQNVDFLRFVWQNRGSSEVFNRLFDSFRKRQSEGLGFLGQLRTLIEDKLGLQARPVGARNPKAAAEATADAQLVFLDLFLGPKQDERARKRSVDQARDIVRANPANPPLLVLMSSSSRLEILGEDFRGDGDLHGCQFRTISKGRIEAEDRPFFETIFQLASRFRDTQKLVAFVAAWNLALTQATERFLKKIRLLDLRDYADIQQLVLSSQGEHVGSYMREVYDQFFHYELESDGALTAAARGIDAISWMEYPPPHFLPERFVWDIVDGLLFFHTDAVEPTSDIEFGDVLFATSADASAPDAEPRVDFAQGERLALLVLTQACDLKQGNAKRVLFLTGVARPSRLVHHKRPDALITPSLIVDDTRYVVEWELGAPMTQTPSQLTRALDSQTYRRVRRFRPLHALQLQQRFVGNLSRVGTPVMPPPQHFVGVAVSYRALDGSIVPLVSVSSEEQRAVVLVGRDKKKHTDYLALSHGFVDKVREAMGKVGSAVVATKEKDKNRWIAAQDAHEFFWRMENGIAHDRAGSERAFAGKDFDVLQVIGPYAKQSPISMARKAGADIGPLVIEITEGSQRLEVPAKLEEPKVEASITVTAPVQHQELRVATEVEPKVEASITVTAPVQHQELRVATEVAKESEAKAPREDMAPAQEEKPKV